MAMLDTVLCEKCGAVVALSESDIAFAASMGKDALDAEQVGWECEECAYAEYLREEEQAEEESRRMWNEYGDEFYRNHPHG